MNIRLFTAVTLLSPGLLVLPALAHHPLGEVYARNSSIELTGTVARIDWVNPHAALVLDVEGPDGTVVAWQVDMDPPHVLFRRGWDRDSITPGLVISVAGYRSLDGSLRMEARTITLPGGAMLEASTEGSWSWVRDSGGPPSIP